MFPTKPSKDPETIGYDLFKDVERIRDNFPQQTSCDISPSHALAPPIDIYQNQESEDIFF